jgi:hypothetical protein
MQKEVPNEQKGNNNQPSQEVEQFNRNPTQTTA